MNLKSAILLSGFLFISNYADAQDLPREETEHQACLPSPVLRDTPLDIDFKRNDRKRSLWETACEGCLTGKVETSCEIVVVCNDKPNERAIYENLGCTVDCVVGNPQGIFPNVKDGCVQLCQLNCGADLSNCKCDLRE